MKEILGRREIGRVSLIAIERRAGYKVRANYLRASLIPADPRWAVNSEGIASRNSPVLIFFFFQKFLRLADPIYIVTMHVHECLLFPVAATPGEWEKSIKSFPILRVFREGRRR